MLKNYLTIALRSLKRHPGYTFINVVGLAVGMACCMVILLYVREELSYDRFHANADRVVRVTRSWFNDDGAVSLHLGQVAPPIGPLLEQTFPEVLTAVRVWGGGTTLVSVEGRHFSEERVFFAEQDLFDVFTIPLLQGDPATALAEPNTVLVSQATARKYFGDADPVGQTLRFDGQLDLRVTGVMEDVPSNTHWHYDLLGSFSTLIPLFGEEEWTRWGSNNYATYLLLPAGYDPAALEAKLPAFLNAHYFEEASRETRLHLQPLTRIHLHSHLDSEIEPNGDIRYVYIFSAVALFLLLIACFNFMNLSTARAASRAREVGLRKVMGAHRTQLVRQFLSESTLLAFGALLLAFLLVVLVLPAFNLVGGRDLALGAEDLGFILPAFAGLALLVGLGAGSYPSFVLSAFQPVRVLKGTPWGGGRGRSALRTTLVVLQFAISIALLVCVGAVMNQLDYLQSKRLGFDREHLLVLSATDEMRDDFEAVRGRLLAHAGITAVTASRRVPSGRLLDSSDATADVDGAALPVDARIAYVSVDHAFLDTYGMTLAAGRDFSKYRASDSTEAFILNEEAVRQIGWETPEAAVGKTFIYGHRRGHIIGVVKDFHFESLHQSIAPIVFFVRPSDYRLVTIRTAGQDLPGTLAFLEAQWQAYRPNYPFTPGFIDARFAALYDAEARLGRLFGLFAGLAVLIACLGLFGLAAFTTTQRTKEIGIRKVLGASVAGITLMLSKEYARLVGFAFLLGTPLAFIAMQRWLEGFAYRTALSPNLFALAGLTALGVALLTVGYRCVRAALTDPAETLRYE